MLRAPPPPRPRLVPPTKAMSSTPTCLDSLSQTPHSGHLRTKFISDSFVRIEKRKTRKTRQEHSEVEGARQGGTRGKRKDPRKGSCHDGMRWLGIFRGAGKDEGLSMVGAQGGRHQASCSHSM